VEGLVFGTYLHGLFDSQEAVTRLADWLGARKGITINTSVTEPRSAYRQKQYNILADAVRASLDMGKIYQAMEAYHH
jgi:adenosylcobyric acid synthase